ncbi:MULTISPECIES: 50S ribosomal protein L21 [unclassified Polaribacter]|uniref:50S ribosomal protein L21 n=1 Tax=unclassified Polaribacter TaxID=196858 RepID=UPI0011BD8FF4|nr:MULTISPECIES: 50S ribosomal protein L21 [unclassified Polaribacter]TXD51600.1 50S ribosomal protein L21 [Polaribacter sp. IC063]TXD61964.1 50S ribosomal protein L21 [Polaribacter sp. IC066]
MYAIVEMAGQQFKVAKDQKVYVHRLQGEAGSKVTFDNVLLLDDAGNVTIGAPAIEGASVTAQILNHLKGDKVIVFKKKRRKGYIKKNGHRQYLSEIQIESITTTGAKKSAEKEVAPKEEAKAEVQEATTDYSSMTVAELKEAAKEKGISGYTSLKKAELIEALTK